MHHPFNVQRIQRDENTKASDAGHTTAKDLANTFFDKPALEPGLDIPRGIVGASFCCRQHQTDFFPDIVLVFASSGSRS